MIDRRGAIASFLASPLLAKAGVDAKEIEFKPGVRKLLVFKLNARLHGELVARVKDDIRTEMERLGVKEPAILLPYELSLDVHEIAE
jgi:hypothetical protein